MSAANSTPAAIVEPLAKKKNSLSKNFAVKDRISKN